MASYSPEIKAQVILEWEAGASQKQLVAKYDVPQTTIRRWVGDRQRVAPSAAPKNNGPTIDDLAYDLVSETFRALVAIARQAQDPAWLKEQRADGLHLLFGVGADKVIRLYEAIDPERLRQLEAARSSV